MDRGSRRVLQLISFPTYCRRVEQSRAWNNKTWTTGQLHLSSLPDQVIAHPEHSLLSIPPTHKALEAGLFMCIFCSIIYRKISIQLIIMLIKPVLANYGDDDDRYMFIT